MLLTDQPRPGAGVLHQEVSGTVVLLHPHSGRYFSLEEVSMRVWELCDGSRTVAEIVATVHAEYDAPVEEVEEDVVSLLDELAEEKLLTTA